jgi:predicted nucleic acid-binding protein
MLPTENVTRLGAPAQQRAPSVGPVPPFTGPETARVVLDTNTVLDWLLFGEPFARAVGMAVAERRVTWLTTPRMLAELRAVLTRPLAARWETAREHALTIDVPVMATLCAEPRPAGSGRLICRDRDDQIFIDLALAHRPSTLLTRDRALLALRRRAAARDVVVARASDWPWPPR